MIAQGKSKGSDISDKDKEEIKQLYKAILGVRDLSTIDIDILATTLEPDSLLEKFAARK